MNYESSYTNSGVIPGREVSKQFFGVMHKFLALIVIAWMTNGIFTYALPYIPNFIRWGIYIAWFGLAILHNRKFASTFIVQTWPLMVFYLYIISISLLKGTNDSTVTTSFAYLIMVYSIFLYYFEDKYRRFSKIIVSFLFLEIIFIAINTYLRLQINPLISRYLAAGPARLEQIYSSANYNGIGSYGYFYTLVAVILLLFYIFLNDRKIITLILVVPLIFLLIKASFTISILFTFIFIISMVLLKYTNKYLFVSFALIGSFFLVIFQGSLSPIFEYLSEIDGLSSALAIRFNEIAFFLSGDNITGTDLQARNYFYASSWDAFIHHPLFGISISFSDHYAAGGHSAWLDTLSLYGFMFLLFFWFLFKAYRYTINAVPSKFRDFVNIYWMYFICLGAINTLLAGCFFVIWFLFLPLAITSFFSPSTSPDNLKESS